MSLGDTVTCAHHTLKSICSKEAVALAIFVTNVHSSSSSSTSLSPVGAPLIHRPHEYSSWDGFTLEFQELRKGLFIFSPKFPFLFGCGGCVWGVEAAALPL